MNVGHVHDLGRVVNDAHSGMSYRFSARVVEVAPTWWKKRRRWQYVIDKYFVHWSSGYYVSRKYYDPGEAMKAANEWLDDRSTRKGTPV